MKVAVSQHAALRYQERVKPTLDLVAAKQELEALVRACGPAESEAPEWAREVRPGTEFITLADGIAAGVTGGVVATVLVRGGSSPHRRAERNKHKANLKAGRLHKSRSSTRRKRGGRPERSGAWD